VLGLACDLPWRAAGRGATHRIHAMGAPVGILAVRDLSLLGERWTISRLGSGGAWSAFEEGRREECAGSGISARGYYFLVLHGDPGHATAWQRVAATLLAEGDRRGAYRCLIFALLGDPGSVETQTRLAAIYLEHRLAPEADFHLEAARAAGAIPEDLASIRAGADPGR
jgi:hypothetical protein